ncbi:MAG: c-type cytochrome, partial [Longimicrobiales bacterium]
ALLARQLPCLGCHALKGTGGRIAPDLSAAADRLRPAALRDMIVAPQAARPGTIMPPTPLPARVVERVTAYLRSLDTGDVATQLSLADEPILLPGDRAGGPGLYRTYCAHCHGASGKGDGWNARFLPTPPTAHADSMLMAGRSDDALFDAIHAGGRIMGRSARMPAFGGLLDAGQIRDLVDYLRVLCDCTGPKWAEEGGHGA